MPKCLRPYQQKCPGERWDYSDKQINPATGKTLRQLVGQGFYQLPDQSGRAPGFLEKTLSLQDPQYLQDLSTES
jgi:hypothetical protein